MKKTYTIEVDCANCAAKMEESIKKIDGIVTASVNFLALKLIIDFEDGANERKILKQVLKACRKIEPDCEIEV